MPAQTPDEKYSVLLDHLQSFESVAVAFSGGVDSSLLLHAAREALGERAIAITAQSRLFPQRELDEASAFCRDRSILQLVVNTNELEDDAFRQNPSNRCYLCKTACCAPSFKWQMRMESKRLSRDQISTMGMIIVREFGQ